MTAVVPERTLLIAMMVRAPSALRSAANTARVSGVGATAETLVSPKPDPRLS
jgi:hypothetical protein